MKTKISRLNISRLLLAVWVLSLLASLAFGQTVGPASITSTQCSPAIGISPSTAVVGIQVTGTWTGTLQPHGTIQGQSAFNLQVTPSNSATAQATITTNGAYSALVAGYSTFQLCGNTVSGSASVVLNASQAPGGGGGGGGGGPFSGITAGTNAAALVEGSGGSLVPSGTGQIVASRNWLAPAAGIAPSPLGHTSDCRSGLNPNFWVMDASLNWEQAAGIDVDAVLTPYSEKGFLAYCRPVLFNVTQTPPAGSSSFTYSGALNIYNRQAASGPVIGEQILSDDAASDTGTYASGLRGLVSEIDIWGNPHISGSDVGYQAVRGSAILANTAPVFMNTGTSPFIGVSGLAQRRSGSNAVGIDFVGVDGLAQDDGIGEESGTFIGGRFKAQNNNSSALGVGVQIDQSTLPFSVMNVGLYFDSNWTPSFAATAVIASASGANMWTMGRWLLSGIGSSGGAVPFTASVTGMNSLSLAQLALPGAPSVGAVGTPGSTSYSYAVVALDGNGGGISSATDTPIADGNAILSAGNPNLIGWSCQPGVASYDIYRTASSGTPGSTGKIANVVVANLASFTGGSRPCNMLDTGLAGDGAALPASNTTASLKAWKFSTLTNCAASGTAANPSVVACASASAGLIYCDVAASAGTCTVNTSAVTANSEILLTPNTADGTVLSQTCNTAPSVVPFALLAAKSAGVSFTITMPTLTVNGACFEYQIIN